MKTRHVLIGCAAVTILALGAAVVAGVIAWRRITAHAPPVEPSSLIAEDSTGFAALRFEPDNAWFGAMLHSAGDLSEAAPEDLLPMSLIWVTREGGGTSVSLSIEPRGRMFGALLDFALWRAGTSSERGIARFEHGGEGITSFPDTGIPGYAFVRGNAFVWTSDAEAARRSVDLMTRPPDSGGAGVSRFIEPERSRHALHGAVTTADGALARVLGWIAGDAPAGLQDAEPDLEGVEAMGFFVDVDSADTATGEVRLHFREDTPAERARESTIGIAARLSRLSAGEVVFTATPAPDAGPGVIRLEASGLETLDRRIEGLVESLFASIAKVDRSGTIVFDTD